MIAANSKGADVPNLSQKIPANRLAGRVISPVNVATAPSAVALNSGLAISDSIS